LKESLKQAEDTKIDTKNENLRLQAINAEMSREMNAAKDENLRLQAINAEMSREMNAAKD
jgi:hypothetical protein